MSFVADGHRRSKTKLQMVEGKRECLKLWRCLSFGTCIELAANTAQKKC